MSAARCNQREKEENAVLAQEGIVITKVESNRRSASVPNKSPLFGTEFVQLVNTIERCVLQGHPHPFSGPKQLSRTEFVAKCVAYHKAAQQNKDRTHRATQSQLARTYSQRYALKKVSSKDIRQMENELIQFFEKVLPDDVSNGHVVNPTDVFTYCTEFDANVPQGNSVTFLANQSWDAANILFPLDSIPDALQSRVVAQRRRLLTQIKRFTRQTGLSDWPADIWLQETYEWVPNEGQGIAVRKRGQVLFCDVMKRCLMINQDCMVQVGRHQAMLEVQIKI